MAGMDLGIEGLSDAEPVGSGGNAVVYRAREVDHDRWVAVKVLRGLADEAAMRRFDRERQAMGRLSEHDGIVTIYSSGFTKTGEPYLVMPLLSTSLQDRLDESGPMEWREAVDLIVVVARTVDAAHAQDVIHRDLKPGNILLSAGGAPLVADFGIARLTGSTTAMQSTALTFTPSYSPPEAFDGAPASKAGDIYALAATLYALVAGTPPFVTESDESVFALMRRIATESVGDLRTLGVADQVCLVVETAMHKDPEQRHDSAADLATALAAAGAPADPTTRIVAAAAVPPAVEATPAPPAAQPPAAAPPPPAAQPLAPPLPAAPAPANDTKRNGMLIVVVVLLILAVGGSTAALIVALSDDPSGSTDTSADADDAATATSTTATPETTAEPATTAESTTTPAATTPTPVVLEIPPPTGPSFRSWAVVVDSFADCTAAGIINSSEYPSLTPDLCVELGGTAGSEAGAETLLDPCISVGCYVRYLGSGPPSGQWVVVWRALATDEVTYQEALAVADTIDAQMGVDFRGYSRILLSDDYLTFADGFWVVFSRSLETATEAFDFCNEIGAVDCDVQQLFRADGD